MVSVEEASRIVFSNLYKPSIETVPMEQALGRILAEPVLTDRAFPPFDRVAMDGIAIRFELWSGGTRSFSIENTQAAGEPRKSLSDKRNCIEVMTGAVLPENTDTVIRYEDLLITGGVAEVKTSDIQKGQNVHPLGADAKANETLLYPGFHLSPAEIALLASVGKATIAVKTLPQVAVISSGNELVDIHDIPQEHQIRRSNSYALASAVRQLGCEVNIFHFPDDLQILKEKMQELVGQYDVLILSGGVSKGKFDYIPQALEFAGVKKSFHEVSQRPGKPLWFGANDKGNVVFALPGNPVSTFMCFYRYVKPWILKSLGMDLPLENAILKSDLTFAPKLTYFLQVKAVNEDGKLLATPLAGGGSGDFANLKDVTGFLQLPLDRSDFHAGESYPYIPFRQ